MSNRVLFALAVLDPGRDEPGILASLSSVLSGLHCNAEDVFSKPLSGHCATMLTAQGPPEVNEDDLFARIGTKLDAFGWNYKIWPLPEILPARSAGSEFYAGLEGPDREGIVSAVTELLQLHSANIASLDCEIVDRKSKYVVHVRGTLSPGEHRDPRAELSRRRRLEDDLLDLAERLELYPVVNWDKEAWDN